jgi:uncharacterized SAM-binding protein YcdF (DUF218 family)
MVGKKTGLFRRIFTWYRWTVAVLLLSLLVLFFTPVGITIGDRLILGTSAELLRPADAIVVLGGDRARSVDGALLYRRGLAPAVIVSGEPALMAPPMEHCGVPRKVTFIDDLSATTEDHPWTIIPFLPKGTGSSIIVVTSQFHHLRSRYVFQKAGYDQLQFYSQDYTDWQQWPRPYLGIKAGSQVLYELLGVARYLVYLKKR